MNLFTTELRSQQEPLTNLFSKALSNNKLAHAYLLIGSNNVANFNLSLELAMLLNCQNKLVLEQGHCYKLKEAEELVICQNCQWLFEQNHPKCFTVIKSQDDDKKIKIDQIRDINQDLSLTSSFFRVIFFANASSDVLHRPAANSLLKTLEEPKVKALFILAASQEFDILPTLRSRCQVFSVNSNNLSDNITLNPRLWEILNLEQGGFCKISNQERLELITILDSESKNFKLTKIHDQLLHCHFNKYNNKINYLNAFQELIIKHLEYNKNYVNTFSSWFWFVENWFKLAERYL